MLFMNLAAQDLSEFQNTQLFDSESKKYESSLERFYRTRSITRNIVPQVLENQLDTEQYIVGPGDQFSLHIFGELETEFTFMVFPEGVVDITTVGAIEVNGLSLKDAKEKIYQKVRDNYIKAEISIRLTGLRKFRVYLTGEIKIPGTYFAQGSDRVSDLIEVAEGLTDWADETAIEIIHSDNTSEVVNLSQFYRESDKSQNPFIRGGDIINATPIDLTKPYVLVESRIQKLLSSSEEMQQVLEDKSTRNIYKLLPDENIIGFLSRISALSAEIDLSNITLQRMDEEYTIDLLNNFDKFTDFKLQSKDVLVIPNLISEVYVQGEVLNPGSFPFTVNMKAKDYAGMAGLIEKAVDIDDLKVIRAATSRVEEGGDVIVEKGDTIIVPRKFRETLKDYVSIILPVLNIALLTYSITTR